MSLFAPPTTALVDQSHPVLHAVASPVLAFDDVLRRLAQEMIVVMRQEKGIGLAAPQVGHSIRMIVLLNLTTNIPEVWVNPHILSQEGWRTGEEGCLSLPGQRVSKTRSAKVVFSAQDLNGKTHQLTREGLAATCVQHEIDHLNGILMTDV